MKSDVRSARMPRNTMVLIADAIAFVGCFYLTSWLVNAHFEGQRGLLVLALSLVIGMLVFRHVGLYRAIWRFASLPDLRNIVVATTVVTAIVTLFGLVLLPAGPRLSFGVVFWFILLVLLSGPRLAYRYYREWLVSSRRRDLGKPSRALLIGTPDEVGNLIGGFSRTSSEDLTISGILSMKASDRGRSVQGVPVLGTPFEIETVLDRLSQFGAPVQNLIASGKSLSERDDISAVFAAARRRGLHIYRFADMTASQITSRDSRSSLQPLTAQDVLIRPIVQIDRSILSDFSAPRRFLVTGGAGSIGSLLVEALITYGAREVIALDISETSIARLMQSGRVDGAGDRLRTIIGDVRSAADMERIISNVRPDVVIHAAALKHVDLAEINAIETFRTNVLGTVNVVRAAAASGVQTCINISTDKAVDPVSVLGRTKRGAELFVDAAAAVPGPCRFATLRFGNVLGSEGSAVPLFLAQIARGGPVTVTDERVTRFFMTAEEARDMILAVASHISAGKTDAPLFLLDMGQPIRIRELAERLIRMSGFEVERDIKIELIGLRPGERLEEKLKSKDETYASTTLPGVLSVERPRVDGAFLDAKIRRLSEIAQGGSDEAMRRALGEAFGNAPAEPLSARTGT